MQAGAGRLPFWATFQHAHKALGEHFSAIARFSGPWFAGLIAVSAILEWLYYPRSQEANAPFSWFDLAYLALLTLLPLLVGAIVGVFLHRRILLTGRLSEGTSASLHISLVNAYFWKYSALGILFVLSLCLLVATGLLVAIIFTRTEIFPSESTGCIICLALPILALPVSSYIPVRFSLSLPATAVCSLRSTFLHSWTATRGNFWKLFLGATLSYWSFLPLIASMVLWSDLESMSRAQTVIWNVVGTVAFFFSCLVSTAYFSLAYRHLTGEPNLQQD